MVADAILSGSVVSPEIQRIANLLLAKSLIDGRLPPKAPGRPYDEAAEVKHFECAYRYFDLLDKNTPRPDEHVSAQMHMESRQIQRYAKEFKQLIGSSPAERDRFRAWRDGVGEESYLEGIRIYLRQHRGLPAVKPDSMQSSRAVNAEKLIEDVRQELARLAGLA
jgi:hypothetical protein